MAAPSFFLNLFPNLSLPQNPKLNSTKQDVPHSRLVLTEEGKDFAAHGSSEFRTFCAVPAGDEGIDLVSLKESLPAAEAGYGAAVKCKWLRAVKVEKTAEEKAAEEKGAAEAAAQGKKAVKLPPKTRVARAVAETGGDPVGDACKALAAALEAEDRAAAEARAAGGGESSSSSSAAAVATINEADAAMLKKRKLAAVDSWKTYSLTKGPKFALERRKLEADVKAEHLVAAASAKGGSGASETPVPIWKTTDYKPVNLAALGAQPQAGALHPLLKVRSAYRRIFTGMGFEEMDTNAWVESSFWNFDALFQPQQHPARDAHDTFFVAKSKKASSSSSASSEAGATAMEADGDDPSPSPSSPLPCAATTPLAKGAPADYADRVREVHERGGFGSEGYLCPWSPLEAEKNLLRTHTTAVSSRMLFRLARAGFKPARLFSIDRVFRNEAIDRTHLAEFHQVEGLVCGKGVTLGDLIGTLKEFFERLGLRSDRIRFKPAYNPYTEPSMEIFSYSEDLDKWMEVGNSGMFRPEMLRPMGLPEDVNVIAWGLSLERPTMILYGIDNIRDLFGHKVSLATVRRNPVCRLGF